MTLTPHDGHDSDMTPPPLALIVGLWHRSSVFPSSCSRDSTICSCSATLVPFFHEGRMLRRTRRARICGCVMERNRGMCTSPHTNPPEGKTRATDCACELVCGLPASGQELRHLLGRHNHV